MAVLPGAPNGSPWKQFGFRYNFGNWGNTSIRQKELKKAQRKRLKETAKLPQRRKKKNKRQHYETCFQSHFTENGISLNNAEAYGDALQKKKPDYTRGIPKCTLLP
jgi:hypothetical protein